jgi:ABC-type oligopeptide transport system substrate-binding subunit
VAESPSWSTHPTDENYWIGTNIAGLSDRGYDDACRTANLALPEDFDEAIHQAEKKFLDVLPAVPLFSMPRVMAMTADGCENGEISTESEFFRQLGEYQLGPDCR